MSKYYNEQILRQICNAIEKNQEIIDNIQSTLDIAIAEREILKDLKCDVEIELR